MSDRFVLGIDEKPDWADGASKSGKVLRAQLRDGKFSGPFKLFFEGEFSLDEVKAFFDDDYCDWPKVDDFWMIGVRGGHILEHPTMEEIEADWWKFEHGLD